MCSRPTRRIRRATDCEWIVTPISFMFSPTHSLPLLWVPCEYRSTCLFSTTSLLSLLTCSSVLCAPCSVHVPSIMPNEHSTPLHMPQGLFYAVIGLMTGSYLFVCRSLKRNSKDHTFSCCTTFLRFDEVDLAVYHDPEERRLTMVFTAAQTTAFFEDVDRNQ